METVGLETFYRGKNIFVTGHTGFKGAWLCWWLKTLGAKTTGFALPPRDIRGNLFNATGLGNEIISLYGDIRNYADLQQALAASGAEIVFHLAAQPLVRASYAEPLENYGSNVMGTVNLLEAVRNCQHVQTAIIVTSDKCYENLETPEAYRETDRLGGYDPYSASKAMAEIATNSYRLSFLAARGIATARAGNVLGGGDFGEDRLVPDIIEAIKNGKPVMLRYPDAIRPWQHVLDVLHGYLMLAKKLHGLPQEFSSPFNFSPNQPINNDFTVLRLTQDFIASLKMGEYIMEKPGQAWHEAKLLRLDSTKAATALGWRNLLTTKEAIDWTAEWYLQGWLSGASNARNITLRQLEDYAKRF